MQRLLDDLVGHVRTIEVARVDVVDARGQGFAQHGDGRLGIARRSVHAGTGQLHGAVAHAVQGQGVARQREGAAEILSHGGGIVVGFHVVKRRCAKIKGLQMTFYIFCHLLFPGACDEFSSKVICP